MALNVIFPRLCVVCGNSIESDWGCNNICAICASKILWLPAKQVPNIISSCKLGLWSFGFVKQLFGSGQICFEHAGVGRNLILALKYGNCEFLVKDIVYLIRKKRPDIMEYLAHSILVPVPLSYRKRVLRDYNQSLLIANELAKYADDAHVENLLCSKYHRSQTSLSPKERILNAKNSFFARKSEKNHNKHLVVIDDVMTTGATLAACCSALFDQGFINVDVLTLSHG
ncbi:MAG: hypothetical protein K2L13_00270 [Opitutales bacterium]|nr:hypothetical protein [Opitutales bacterium]